MLYRCCWEKSRNFFGADFKKILIIYYIIYDIRYNQICNVIYNSNLLRRNSYSFLSSTDRAWTIVCQSFQKQHRWLIRINHELYIIWYIIWNISDIHPIIYNQNFLEICSEELPTLSSAAPIEHEQSYASGFRSNIDD